MGVLILQFLEKKKKRLPRPIQRGVRGLQAAHPATASCSDFIYGFLYSSFLDGAHRASAAFKASPPWETMQEHAAEAARFSLTYSHGLEARIPAPKPSPQPASPPSRPFTYSTHTNTHTQRGQQGRAGPDHSANRRGEPPRAHLTFAHTFPLRTHLSLHLAVTLGKKST